MIDTLLKIVAEQLRVIADAWFVFGAAVIVIIWGVLRFARWWHADILVHKDVVIAAKEATINLMKEQLKGETDQANATVQGLEEVIRRAVGSRWEPLSHGEIRNLSGELRKIERRRVQVMYLNRYGKELAQSLADAFEAAGGWEVVSSMGGGFEEGIFVGRTPKLSPLLKRAIEATTKLKVEMILDTEDARDGAESSVFVAVGVNPK